MKRNKLGSTDILVSDMCFGSLTISPLQLNLPVKDGQNLIEEAIELDINFFDTAHIYNNYFFFKELPQDKKNKIVIASKSYSFDFDSMMDDIEYGLKSIKREYFDIFLLHEQESILTLKGHSKALEAMIKAKEQGKIREIGVSTHTVSFVKDLMLHPEFKIIHPIFNKDGIGYKNGTIPEQEDAIKNLYNSGYGIYTMKALGGGKLYNSFLDAINYVKGFPYKHSVAIGVRDKNELFVDASIFNEKYKDSYIEKLNLKEKKLFYNREYCELCFKCVDTCPFNAILKGENEIIIDTDKCALCGYCISSCNNLGLRMI
jgi:uncharacterized protein